MNARWAIVARLRQGFDRVSLAIHRQAKVEALCAQAREKRSVRHQGVEGVDDLIRREAFAEAVKMLNQMAKEAGGSNIAASSWLMEAKARLEARAKGE